MRRKLIEADVIECVLGLGPNLFYNSPMEACVVICRTAKPKAHKGKILFINAVDEVTRERAQSFLTDDHIERIVKAYKKFKDEPGFTRVATLEQIRAKDGSLSIPLYVEAVTTNGKLATTETSSLAGALNGWIESYGKVAEALAKILPKSKSPKLEALFCGSDTCELLKGRAKWTRVRFGDLVENLNETESNPAETGLERFIGLEHLEPGSLHIRSWGNVADGTTFTRRCRPGHVLFGKRRAYQRKVAIAEFDAVVSGDIYVLAPKNDRLVSGLLPFLCLSERFFQHAVGTSAGSLSPRTNWGSLASFELDLPTLDQQLRISEILWAMDEAEQGAVDMWKALEIMRDAEFDEALKRDTASKPENLKRLGDVLCQIVAGKSPKAASEPASQDGFGVLKVSAVGDGEYREEENKALLEETEFNSDLEVKQGMILVTRCNAVLSGIGRACVVKQTRRGLMLSDKTLQLVPAEAINPDFLLQGLRREPYRGFVERSANGTEAKNISQETLRKAPFWIPSLTRQLAVTERLNRFSESIHSAQKQVSSLTKLRSTITNTVFSSL